MKTFKIFLSEITRPKAIVFIMKHYLEASNKSVQITVLGSQFFTLADHREKKIKYLLV